MANVPQRPVPRYRNDIPALIDPNRTLVAVDELLNQQHHFVLNCVNLRRGSANSRFIGTHVLQAGNPGDRLVPVMVHCPWPPNNFRRAILYVKPSISPIDFDSAVHDVFRVVDNGLACKELVVIWMDRSPFEYPDWAARVGVTTYPNPIPTLEQNLRMLGLTMNGIFELQLMPLEEALKCYICRAPPSASTSTDPRILQALRKTLASGMMICDACFDEFYELVLGIGYRKREVAPQNLFEWLIRDRARCCWKGQNEEPA